MSSSIWLRSASILWALAGIGNIIHPIVFNNLETWGDILPHPILGVVLLLLANILWRIARAVQAGSLDARRMVRLLLVGMALTGVLSLLAAALAPAIVCNLAALLLVIEVFSWKSRDHATARVTG